MAEGFDNPMYEDDYDKEEVDDEFDDETQLLPKELPSVPSEPADIHRNNIKLQQIFTSFYTPVHIIESVKLTTCA